MTSGSLAIVAGVPLAISLPNSSTWARLGNRADEAEVVLDQDDRRAGVGGSGDHLAESLDLLVASPDAGSSSSSSPGLPHSARATSSSRRVPSDRLLASLSARWSSPTSSSSASASRRSARRERQYRGRRRIEARTPQRSASKRPDATTSRTDTPRGTLGVWKVRPTPSRATRCGAIARERLLAEGDRAGSRPACSRRSGSASSSCRSRWPRSARSRDRAPRSAKRPSTALLPPKLFETDPIVSRRPSSGADRSSSRASERARRSASCRCSATCADSEPASSPSAASLSPTRQPARAEGKPLAQAAETVAEDDRRRRSGTRRRRPARTARTRASSRPELEQRRRDEDAVHALDAAEQRSRNDADGQAQVRTIDGVTTRLMNPNRHPAMPAGNAPIVYAITFSRRGSSTPASWPAPATARRIRKITPYREVTRLR